MARPRHCRRIGHKPDSVRFKPQGIPARELEEVSLQFDELEALRLKDVLQQDQKIAAESMHISQPTFHRLLKDARQKIATAIVLGKSLRIEGGSYEFKNQTQKIKHLNESNLE